LRRALGRADDLNSQRNWRLEVQSVRALHSVFGSDALQELVLLSDAQSQESVQNYREAASILDRLLQSGVAARCGMSDELMRIEIDWCLAMDGRLNVDPDKMAAILAAIDGLSMNERLIACFFAGELAAGIAAAAGGAEIAARIAELRAPALVDLDRTLQAMAVAVANVAQYRPIADAALGQ
jgi:hypothetical protein